MYIIMYSKKTLIYNFHKKKDIYLSLKRNENNTESN